MSLESGNLEHEPGMPTTVCMGLPFAIVVDRVM